MEVDFDFDTVLLCKKEMIVSSGIAQHIINIQDLFISENL